MTIQTRQPTGKPPWPITLIAGGEKAGKSYAAALASASDLIDRTFWIGVGEDDPDEYGAIPGARFEIVPHNGTYREILGKVREAVTEPTPNGKPNLVVIDSGTRLWEMLSDEAQARANARRKGAKTDAEAVIGPDLWNRATNQWFDVMDALRAHNGPSIITARLDIVTVMDASGKPTKEKTSKVKAQKSLPYDVGVVIEIPERGQTYITGVRSLKYDVQVGDKKPLPDFTMDNLWRMLGVDVDGATAPRQYSGADGRTSATMADTAPTDADAAAAAVNRYRNTRTPHPEPAPESQTPPVQTQPDWPALFAAASGNRDKLMALRNQGHRAGIPNTYGMFAAIDAELARLASETPVEGTLVTAS